MKKHRSLRWRITLGLILFEAAVLIPLAMLGIAVLFNPSIRGVAVNPALIQAIGDSLGRDDQGHLTLYPNGTLSQMMASSPELWIVVRSETRDDHFTFGPVPDPANALMARVDLLKFFDMRGTDTDPILTASFLRIDTRVGHFAVLAGGGGFVSDIMAVLLLGNVVIMLPLLALVVLTLVCIPPFVGWSMRSIRGLSAQIELINFQARGSQLPLDGLPKEIVPIVTGMNEALRRIDAGFELTERFFVNAAHELRTPVAILHVRLDALPPGPERDKLQDVARRLTDMSNQLLDLERFRQNPIDLRFMNLTDVVSQAVADLAPYAVAEGYTIALDAPEEPVWINGDAAALDRMLANLIQNAIRHGGQQGTIVARLAPDGTIEVSDQGQGVPFDRRERIFEPFYRVNANGTGAGLGLKMVRDIARSHKGEAFLADTSPQGSTFRVTLPVMSRQQIHDGIRNGQILSPDRV